VRDYRVAIRTGLVDEIADVGEDGVVQIDTQELSTEWGSEVLFEILQHIGRQIGLPTEQAQQGSAIGWTLVVAWQAASWADCQREGDRSRAWLEMVNGPGNEIHSHAGILTPDCGRLNGTEELFAEPNGGKGTIVEFRPLCKNLIIVDFEKARELLRTLN
jgi:hypothetical protein